VPAASWGGTPAGGGIENSYKSIKDFLAWTASRNMAVRVFYFGFAVIPYDMWLVVDLLGRSVSPLSSD
jgi:IS4 transposase